MRQEQIESEINDVVCLACHIGDELFLQYQITLGDIEAVMETCRRIGLKISKRSISAAVGFNPWLYNARENERLDRAGYMVENIDQYEWPGQSLMNMYYILKSKEREIPERTKQLNLEGKSFLRSKISAKIDTVMHQGKVRTAESLNNVLMTLRETD